MLKKFITAAFTIALMVASVSCTTLNETNVGNEGTSITNVDKSYANYEGDFYVPINNGEKVSVMHKTYDWVTEEFYFSYEIFIDGSKYIQQNCVTKEELICDFDSDIAEIRFVRENYDGPEYAYRTLKNEVGVIANGKKRVFEKGNDNVERKLFYKNEHNNVGEIREHEDYLIYYEEGKLKGANISGSSFWFDDYPYERYGFLGVDAIFVRKGISECMIYTSCPNADRQTPIEELIVESGINY